MADASSTGRAGGRRRPARWPFAAAGLVVAAASGAVLIVDRSNDSDPAAPFAGEQVAMRQAAPEPTSGHPADDGFRWPEFGGGPQRTHALATENAPLPPFRTVWARRGSKILEFPPVSCGRGLYLLRGDGVLLKLSRRTGAAQWKRKLGHLAASAPACTEDRVFVTILERGRGIKAGRAVAVSTENGRTLWSRPFTARTESSPLVFRDRVYFGTEDGNVYSLATQNGAQRWRTSTEGAVKGGLAMSGGKLYAADYSGRVYALRRSDGKVLWMRRPAAGGLRLKAGAFYSTPAVAFGRVYLGSTDGNVYSLSTLDGKTAWRRKTGGYVYGSPAIGTPGGKPTVFIGSYDKRFYALDARNGKVRWSKNLFGRISGSSTLVGGTIWVATLDAGRTFALRASDGYRRYVTNRGHYTPVISDGRRIYLNGLTSTFALDGRGPRFEEGRSPVPPSADPVLTKRPGAATRRTSRKPTPSPATGSRPGAPAPRPRTERPPGPVGGGTAFEVAAPGG